MKSTTDATSSYVVIGLTELDVSTYNIKVGEVAERFKAAVLKTVEGYPPSQGSNPCFSDDSGIYGAL